MRLILFALFMLSCSELAAAEKKPELPDELVLQGDNIIDAVIDGRKLRLEVRSNAPEAPTLNPAIAREMQLKPGMFGFVTSVGPVRVRGASAVLRVDYGKPQKQRVFWASRPVSSLADGVISPSSLPYKRVRFVLGAVTGGEKETALPLDNFGFLGRFGMGIDTKIGDEKMQVSFSLTHDTALVSAPTGNWLARERGGKLFGAARSSLVYYDIERPVRTMTLDQPIAIASFLLPELDVRVGDYGDANGIAEADAVIQGADSEEIVVTGKSDKDIDLRLTLGRNFLKGCSSLTFDLQHDKILLACAP